MEETERPFQSPKLDEGHLATGFSSEWDKEPTRVNSRTRDEKRRICSKNQNDLEQWNKWVEAFQAEVAKEAEAKGMLFPRR